MNKFLCKYQCGFRNGYNAQHCVLAMIEKWKNTVYNGNIFEGPSNGPLQNI